LPTRRWLEPAALLAVLIVSLGAGLVGVTNGAYADPYYGTAVQSMAMSWHNFFFVSYDPAGFLSVDKPPLDLWLQVASVKVFGFSDLSLVLPQALAGAGAVLVLYHLVRRAFGVATGLLAALLLALTPILVATSRNNDPESLVLLTVLLAAWATTLAAERGTLGPLLLGAGALGLSFNENWSQGLLVLPALVLTYLFAAPLQWRTRVPRLGLAAVVLVVVSLCWVTAVDRTPAGQRPQVASSSANSELDLAFGYYGFSRLLSGNAVATAYAGDVGDAAGTNEPFRLFDEELGGQVSWLLPLALAGLAAAVVRARRRPAARTRHGQQQEVSPAFTLEERTALLLWGAWLGTLGLIYTFAGFVHPYYMVLLAPAIAGLAAIGVKLLWQAYGRATESRWQLPAALAGTALIQAIILLESPAWSYWLAPVVLVGAGIAVALLVPATRRRRAVDPRLAELGALVGVVTLLIAPATWASVPVWHYANAELPIAGPDLLNPAVQTISSTEAALAPPLLTHFLLNHQGQERFILAARYGGLASPVMLATGRAVLDYGGYMGGDTVAGVTQVAHLVQQGQVRYFWLLPGQVTPGSVEAWVVTRCAGVPPRLWEQTQHLTASGPRLYDCNAVQKHLPAPQGKAG
jgi:4-amino-4-deoxy-L-arabinose transferase-like glycosyltransferase